MAEDIAIEKKKDINDLISATSFETPDDVLELNAQVMDATKHAGAMIEEIDQLGFSLDKFIEKQRLYNKCKRIVRQRMQDAISEL